MTEPMDPTLEALGALLTYMAAQSGIRLEPGSGTTLHPLADGSVFEVRIGGTSIGTLHRDAILEVADRIRSRRN